MALPYPMPAVSPFDTITAQETNERIANIQALAAGTGFNTGAIPTAALANSSVTAQKIDFTSLYKTTGNMSAITTLTTTAQTAAGITIPAGVTGTVEVAAVFEFNNVGAGYAAYFGIVAKGATVVRQDYNDVFAGGYFMTLTIIAQVSVVPGDVINIRAGRDAGSGGNLVTRSSYAVKQI